MTERKNFDSEFCGSLPLHHVNLIQDYGYLLVLEPANLSLIQASENIVEVTGQPVQDMIGKNIADYMDVPGLQSIKSGLNSGIRQRIPVEVNIKNVSALQPFHGLMHLKEGYILLELENAGEQRKAAFTQVFQKVKKVMAAIDQADTVQAVCEIAVHELRELSGFDGVLMYKFDQDWNGTVVAEEKDDRLEPYIGQTFPASDVPRQARQLYLKNPYRLIPNRAYQPFRLYPVINPVTNSFIDLSDCNLRGVVAVHLEYMKNMNIEASMSIRVIRNGELWGLISCHHLTPKYLDYELCAVFEWLSAVISNGVSRILDKEKYDFSSALQRKRAELTDRIYEEDNIVSGLLPDEGTSLLDLFNATGALIVLNDRIETKGKVPGKEMTDNLLLWVEGKSGSKVFAHNHMSGLYDEAKAFADVGSGLLAIPIDAAKGDYVICFRPEVIETINWGGDPNQAINFEKDGVKYHPRTSFKLWQETVKQYAQPWNEAELEMAEALRSFLFEFRTRQLYN
ncbi:GAF domain-containing protein [Pedobacter africanus]|uniref:PAS fold-containing protein n=1 Tax=Pedobacter africanus TaxID=151894 RepID=A0A1W2BTA8_9SPHI|nr:GAF domain-containing protein [Pedobacter africanus]SMC76235.1 PAS fold-containing protein [Pedobacter africanus]